MFVRLLNKDLETAEQGNNRGNRNELQNFEVFEKQSPRRAASDSYLGVCVVVSDILQISSDPGDVHSHLELRSSCSWLSPSRALVFSSTCFPISSKS